MDHPLLNAFWIMLWFFLWVLWLFLLFRVVMDIFRSHEMSGWGKAGWMILVVLLPYLGVLLYLIVRGAKMGEHDAEDAERREAAVQDYIRKAAGSGDGGAAGDGGDNVDRLAKLAALKADGHLTQEEFDQAKAKLLA
ncbi:SHOCT domain-containing protein [Kitasatospora nipponensis]|uniref:SHOCT domain-containing protein n=1 Tax=Kitasatospora nipponensis TaxID=258049 RepID=A0ABN1X079_9ACTN